MENTILSASRRYRSWFILFFLFNLVFLSLQIGLVATTSSSFIQTLPLPAQVYFELFITLFIHLLLYILLSALQTALIWGLAQYRQTTKSLEHWHLAIWVLSLCALLTSNCYYFPLSTISCLFSPLLPQKLLIILMLFSVLILSLLILNTLFLVCRLFPRKMGGAVVLVISLFAFTTITPNIKTPHNPQNKETNIIFIGIDSLAPNSINEKDTPTLAHFLHDSVFFKNTITPLARTYASWSSILTGLYPQHHKARYNLIPPDLVKSSLSIAWPLQKLGYQTLFATDDRRFNSMGNEFGFQKIIGPKLGVNDVILGTFNDFPLSNLFINLPVSRWLFPYNYINRASYFTYYPQFFDNVLNEALAPNNTNAPLFLAAHFTLPHWPYAWAESSPTQVNNEYNVNEREQLYVATLQRVDMQVANLLHVLQHYGYLDNSLVVLLSDHGEALYLPGSRQTSAQGYQGKGSSAFANYLKRKTSTELDMSMGHGSDLLSSSQYQCVLAFKIYKHHQLQTLPKIINTRVALIDLVPTVRAFLNMPTGQPIDGISLLSTISSNNEPLPERAFIMESGILPNQFLTRETARALGQKFYTISPHTNQLEIRKDQLPTLDKQKLYAIIEKDWILALYPDDDGYIPITLHLTDGKWIDNINSDFARNSPATSMLSYMERFYKKKWPLTRRKGGDQALRKIEVSKLMALN
jgi:arylsulfatase A-like enzyme